MNCVFSSIDSRSEISSSVLLNFASLQPSTFFSTPTESPERPHVNIPLSRELRALGITTEAVETLRLQRQNETNVLQMRPEETLPSTMPKTIKVSKPDKFDGKDTSIATVTAWTFSVEEYMELADIPDEKQTHLAATWLSDNAKVWYINTYKDIKPLPSLEVFLKAFKEQHLTAHSKADVIKRAETICQGFQRGANEYSTEFKMPIHQLGNKSNEPDSWVTRHYLRGLDRTVREGLIPHLEEEDTLDSLIKKATHIARNVEFGKTLDQGSRSSAPRSSINMSSSASTRSTSASQGPSPSSRIRNASIWTKTMDATGVARSTPATCLGIAPTELRRKGRRK